jgi:ribosome-binding factor A
MNHRPERVGKLMREELSKLVTREIEFPSGTLVTLTTAEVNKKMEIAKIGVSVIPSKNADEALRILHKNQGDLQYLLVRKMNIKPMPRIHFFIDYGPDNAAKIEKTLLDNPPLPAEEETTEN